MSDVSSEERERQEEQLADVEEKLADVEEATEQRMHSVADLIPQKSEEIHDAPTGCLRGQRSTAVELSAAAA
jgi:K+/H+ antiporter YhaU regulatory subunit KhtT